MIIKINKDLAAAHADFLTAAPWRLDVPKKGDWRHGERSFDINLGRYKIDSLEKLRQQIGDNPAVRGAKNVVRDIGVWMKACETPQGPAAARANTMKHAAALITELVRRTRRRQLYTREDESDDSVVFSYYVAEVDYSTWKSDGETFERVVIELFYKEFNIRHKTSVTLTPEDCLGKTAPEILARRGYYCETPQLRADYEFYIEQYDAIVGDVGLQCLARGAADSDGVDGNGDKREEWWYSYRSSKLRLDKDGSPSRVVVDVFREEDRESGRRSHDSPINYTFWQRKTNITYDEDGEAVWEGDDVEENTVEGMVEAEIPVHPYVVCFDLKRHKRLRIHVGQLVPYCYDTDIRKGLVLPERHARLIDTLLVQRDGLPFRDIVQNKGGGTIILCQGGPGTGKTLTAEVYAEALKRPLYVVQCAQLGVDPEVLEDNLMKVLARGRRWNAVMLLDEADVYVCERGRDLAQNAIVGVFLRVLEYHAGVLFLTTNRGDLVDDAILSRCTARIPYGPPPPEDQIKIWTALAAANGVVLPRKTIEEIVKAYSNLSGRDIKNLLKLALMVANDRHTPITVDMIADVKEFKPTSGD